MILLENDEPLSLQYELDLEPGPDIADQYGSLGEVDDYIEDMGIF